MIKVAIIGKPNVGKSTLFNRLCSKRLAIIDDMPGVTRDRKEFVVSFEETDFKFIDTAGWDNQKEKLVAYSLEQTKRAIYETNIILFVIDGRTGTSAEDSELIKEVRQSGKSVILLVNKCENLDKIYTQDAYSLGLGEPVFISAEHSIGVEEIVLRLKEIASSFSEEFLNEMKEEKSDFANQTTIAIVGRPNVGKSTLFNQIMGAEHVITSEQSGTTRDSITHEMKLSDEQKLVFVDTAGMRKKSKIEDSIEKWSIAESVNAIRRSEITVLVLDAVNRLEKQDIAIANIAINEGKCIVFVVNKIDLIKDVSRFKGELQEKIEMDFHKITKPRIVYLSALKGKNIGALAREFPGIKKKWQTKISTPRINKWLANAVELHAPPLVKGKYRIKLKYGLQTAVRPPTIKIFSNLPEEIPNSYVKYLVKSFSEKFELQEIPVRLRFTKSNNPFAKKQ